jgi:hypothetical protein
LPAGWPPRDAIPFTSSYAAFSTGRNWEQIKTTAALNDRPVKIVGSCRPNVGPDGAAHQMLEDLALMRVIPEHGGGGTCRQRRGREGNPRLAADPRLATCDWLVMPRPCSPRRMICSSWDARGLLRQGRDIHAGRDRDDDLASAAGRRRARRSRIVDAEVLHFATL